MKRMAILSLGAFVLLLGVSGSAFATKFRISDPDSGTPIYFNELGTPIPLTWGSCSGNGFPQGYDLCAAFDNQTGVPITSLLFQFTVNQFLADAGILECSSDLILTINKCPTGPFTVGQVVTFTFSGQSPIPSEPIEDSVMRPFFSQLSPIFALQIQADGLTDADQLPSMTMTPNPVPEPDALGVFGLGLVLIGLGFGLRRRWQ